MQATDVPLALAAATSVVSELGLSVDDAVVVHDSNRLAVRLVPCDVLARVAHAPDLAAQREVDLAQRLAEVRCPIAPLEPRVQPLVYERDGFALTLWTYEHQAPSGISPGDYAVALQQLHERMRGLELTTQHFTDRIAAGQAIVEQPERSPRLDDSDRELLSRRLRGLSQAILDRAAPEQLLHGEPHPGNVLSATDGPLFIDLETCCRGPVEFDLAHVPEEVSERYPNADRGLLQECQGLVLAMVAAWRCDREDQLPNGRQAGLDLLAALREGPPWPALTTVLPPA